MTKTKKRISVTDHKKCSDIATIASYGLEWAKDDERGDYSTDYALGGVEAVAHQISCCLYQWFRPRIELPTAETRDHFDLESSPSQQRIEAELVKLVKESK